jgi:hypothetical protein
LQEGVGQTGARTKIAKRLLSYEELYFTTRRRGLRGQRVKKV